jgi:hypothetical protein
VGFAGRKLVKVRRKMSADARNPSRSASFNGNSMTRSMMSGELLTLCWHDFPSTRTEELTVEDGRS